MIESCLLGQKHVVAEGLRGCLQAWPLGKNAGTLWRIFDPVKTWRLYHNFVNYLLCRSRDKIKDWKLLVFNLWESIAQKLILIPGV